MFGRSKKLPPALSPVLERDERVLAWARVAGSAGADGATVVVATNRGLWLPGAEGRVGWHEIHKATWGDDRLTVIGSTGKPAEIEGADFTVVSDLPPVSFTLTDPGMLPRRVRDRVTASVAVSTVYRLPAGAVRVVARRVSGMDGLVWSVRFEDGASADDPAALAAAAECVAASKAEIAPVD